MEAQMLVVRGRCPCCAALVENHIEVAFDGPASTYCEDCEPIVQRLAQALPEASCIVVEAAAAIARRDRRTGDAAAALYTEGLRSFGVQTPPVAMSQMPGKLLVRARCTGCAQPIIESQLERKVGHVRFACDACETAIATLQRQLGERPHEDAVAMALYAVAGDGHSVTEPVRVRRAYREALKRVKRAAPRPRN